MKASVLRPRLLALFCSWHLVAITVANLAAPRPVAGGIALPPPDRVAQLLAAAQHLAWQVTSPIRPLVRSYVELTAQAQRWDVFAHPQRADQYLRVRLYFGRERGQPPTRMVTALVVPVRRDDQAKLLQGYRDSYESKAHEVALERFLGKRPAALVAPGTTPDELPDDLAPVARYHARRLARENSGLGSRVLRVEVWHGQVPTPPPGGEPGSEALRLERRAALLEYFDGPVEAGFGIPPFPPYHASEREGDLEWILEYFEEPQ